MDFLNKLDFLMDKYGLNKSSLSNNSDIPYTTIDNWYKRGYDGLKLTTLRKLSSYFNTTLDYWVLDEITDPNYGKTNGFNVDCEEMEHIKKYRILDDHGKEMVNLVLKKEYERSTLPKETVTIYNLPYSFDLPASAGTGEYAMDIAHFKTVGLSEKPPKGADFLIRVSGDSMEPKFSNNDKVFVKRMDAVEKDEIGLFYLDGNVYIKKLGNGELISLNPEYKPIPINEFSSIKCFGKVLGKCECEIIEV